MANSKWNTVASALRALLRKDNATPIHEFKMPKWPPDLFAVAVYLLDRGGVYHRIVPDAAITLTSTPAALQAITDSVLHLAPNFLITEIEIEEWKLLGEKWLECADDIKQIEIVWDEIENKFWKKIIECTDESNPSIKAGEHYKLVKRPNPEILNWWRPAVALLAISDEACSGLGFINKYSDGKYRRHTLERAIIRSKFNKTESFRMKTDSDYKHCVYVRPLTSYTDAIDTSLIRVVPKSTVPTVGCTLRTMSYNLAAVPPIGVVDVSWCSGPSETHVSEGPLNILAIPFPFTIHASAFQAISEVRKDPTPPAKRWGWFHVSQTWLHNIDATTFVTFIMRLIEDAEKDCRTIHGIILPEYAINYDLFKKLIERLATEKPMFEFVVAGSSDNDEGRKANFAISATFHRIKDDNGRDITKVNTHIRAKHHRWQLTGQQIADYALASTLDASRVWWEATELPRREIGVNVFRRDSTFSTMICEDLARSEPVHEPLKSIGPNIVFVLLMDGPQLAGRWSSRYALALADDPGCSVLTLTSKGLIERGNGTGHFGSSDEVGIWKDRTSKIISLKCPSWAHGIICELLHQRATREELSMVGSDSKSAYGNTAAINRSRCLYGTTHLT